MGRRWGGGVIFLSLCFRVARRRQETKRRCRCGEGKGETDEGEEGQDGLEMGWESVWRVRGARAGWAKKNKTVG